MRKTYPTLGLAALISMRTFDRNIFGEVNSPIVRNLRMMKPPRKKRPSESTYLTANPMPLTWQEKKILAELNEIGMIKSKKKFVKSLKQKYGKA